MDKFEFKLTNESIKNALKNDFHVIIGDRSSGKTAYLESLGYKVISYKEYLILMEKVKNE